MVNGRREGAGGGRAPRGCTQVLRAALGGQNGKQAPGPAPGPCPLPTRLPAPELGQGEKSDPPAPAVCKQQRNKEKPPQKAHPRHTHSLTRGESRLSALPGALWPLRSPSAHSPPRGKGCQPRHGGAQPQGPRGSRCPPGQLSTSSWDTLCQGTPWGNHFCPVVFPAFQQRKRKYLLLHTSLTSFPFVQRHQLLTFPPHSQGSERIGKVQVRSVK